MKENKKRPSRSKRHKSISKKKSKDSRGHKSIRTHLKSYGDVQSPCSILSECQSCPLLPDHYTAQLQHKEAHFKDLVTRGGWSTDLLKTPLIPSPYFLSYRHTAKLVVRTQTPLIGLFRPKSHEVIDISGCVVQTERINTVLDVLRELLSQDQIQMYDELNHQGVLRYVVIRQSTHSGRLLLTFVIAVNTPSVLSFFFVLIKELIRRVPEVKGVLYHLNSQRGNAIFDVNGETVSLWGGDSLIEEVGALRLRVSSTSFFQVNPPVAALAYQEVVRGLAPQVGERALDLYCGVGSIALLLALSGCEVIGIEEGSSSVEDARYNAQHNAHLTPLKEREVCFLEGRVEHVLPKLAHCLELQSSHRPHIFTEVDKVDIVALNPSRRGCQPEVISAITALQPRAISYMSCQPRTLLRDLKHLQEGGYVPESFTLFDMFPGSPHYEIVCTLKPSVETQ